MKKLFFSILLSALFATNVSAQNNDVAAIKQLLQKQTEAWNKGSVDDFMQGYLNSDSLLFVGKNGPKYGYLPTLENYKKSYPDTASMGKLTFDIMEMKPLSPQYYFVLGKWHLHRSAGNVEGYFTLVLKKNKNTWTIIADHSS